MARTTMATAREAVVMDLMQWHGGSWDTRVEDMGQAITALADEAANYAPGACTTDPSSTTIHQYRGSVNALIYNGKLEVKLDAVTGRWYFQA